MRSPRSTRSLHLAICAPALAAALLATSLSTTPAVASSAPGASADIVDTLVESGRQAATIHQPDEAAAPADDLPTAPTTAAEPEVPDAVTVVTQTPDGGLTVAEVPTTTPRATARSLNQRPGVVASTVKQRQTLNAPDSDGSARDMQWPLNQLGAEDAWKASTGAGTIVAVLDTGVDAGHPDLAGRVLSGYDATKRRAGGTSDPNGHGTHVAGSIAGSGAISGIAPDARILPVRVMNARGGGNTGDIVAGIVWAVDRGANVINLSLGSRSSDKAEEAAIRWARGRGVIVVAAVGNDGGTKAMFPAAYGDHKRNASGDRDPVIGVGAIHRGGQRAAFSQRGSAVDVAAPGVRVLSTYPRTKGGYAWESGTSMSAPFVAGTAALLISRLNADDPRLTPAQRAGVAVSAIRRSTRALGGSKEFGSGGLDAARALAAIGARTGPGMSHDARLIGGARGRAIASFSTPAGTSVRARLTSAAGSKGATAAADANSGVPVWSGPGGRQVVLSLPDLSMTTSYVLTVFVTRDGATSRTVTGLRPVQLKTKAPKSVSGRSKKKLKIRSLVGPGVGVPGARVSVEFRSSAGRKTIRTSPMTSRPGRIAIPGGAGPLYFTVRADAGDGNWPYAASERTIRRR